jgi:integron integrase
MDSSHDGPRPGRLLARVHAVARSRHLSARTEEAYRSWIVRFVRFHDTRHPATLGEAEVRAFLEWLATEGKLAASTLNQAHAALLFLYRDVLCDPLRCPPTIPYARSASREADTLSAEEAKRLLAEVAPAHRLTVALLYGSGLRLMECLSLRVKDVDFERCRIHVRDGQGGKGRFTMLPEALREALAAQVDRVRHQHGRDVQAGGGYVVLPYAFDRKSPTAVRDWRWAWVFPSRRQYVDGETGKRRRHHVFDTTIQRAVEVAARRAGLSKRVTPHTLRHSFATQLLRSGYDARTVQELMGHRDLSTTMRYLHVLDRGAGVRSPLDAVGLGFDVSWSEDSV